MVKFSLVPVVSPKVTFGNLEKNGTVHMQWRGCGLSGRRDENPEGGPAGGWHLDAKGGSKLPPHVRHIILETNGSGMCWGILYLTTRLSN